MQPDTLTTSPMAHHLRELSAMADAVALELFGDDAREEDVQTIFNILMRVSGKVN